MSEPLPGSGPTNETDRELLMRLDQCAAWLKEAFGADWVVVAIGQSGITTLNSLILPIDKSGDPETVEHLRALAKAIEHR